MNHRIVLVFAAIAVLAACGNDRADNRPPNEGRAQSSASTTEANQPEKGPEPPQPAAVADPGPAAEAAPAIDPRLLDPGSANEEAPAQFTVELDTTKGPIRIDVTRSWAPNGADRFYNLVRIGYYTDVAFFRVLEGFMAQVGIHGEPRVNTAWRRATIVDDPQTQSNTRGMVTFAKTNAPNSRGQQFFISFSDNSNLDPMGFAPFGRVQPDSMSVVDQLYNGYGEGAPRGRGPMQMRMQTEGNPYLRREFPEMDYVRSASIVE